MSAPVTEFQLDSLAADIRAFVDETRNPTGDKERASSFHLSPCGGCGSPSWQQPCASCGYYPYASEDAKRTQLAKSGDQTRLSVSRERWVRQVEAHGNIAAFYVSSYMKTVAWNADPSFKAEIQDLYERAKRIPAPDADAVWNAVVREHRALDGRPETLPVAKRGPDGQWRTELADRGWNADRRSHSGSRPDGRAYYEERRLCRTEDGLYGVFQSVGSWDPKDRDGSTVRTAGVLAASLDRVQMIDAIEDWARHANVNDHLDAIEARGLRGEDDLRLVGAGAVVLRAAAKTVENEDPNVAQSLRKVAEGSAAWVEKAVRSRAQISEPDRRFRLYLTSVSLLEAKAAVERSAADRAPATGAIAGRLAEAARACRDLQPQREAREGVEEARG